MLSLRDCPKSEMRPLSSLGILKLSLSFERCVLNMLTGSVVSE